MKDNINGINTLEKQMANNEDICCSCGNITSFRKPSSKASTWLTLASSCVRQDASRSVVRMWSMMCVRARRRFSRAMLTSPSAVTATTVRW